MNDKDWIPFRKIMDDLPVAVYVTDAKGRLTYYNTAAAKLSGRRPKPGTDRWCVNSKLYYADGTPMPHEEYPMAVALKEGRRIEGKKLIAERPDGKRIWITPFPSPLYDHEGNLTGGVNTLLKLADLKHNKLDSLLRAIIEGSGDAIISKNLNGIITSWNRGAERIFGYSNSEIIGKPVTLLIPDDRLNEEIAILEKLKQGKRVEHFKTIRLKKDGTPVYISLTISPISNTAGKIVGASKIARDITLQKRAEEKLKTINETLEIRVQERTAELLNYQNQLRSLTSRSGKTEEHQRQRIAADLHDNLGQILALVKVKLDLLLKKRVSDDKDSIITETLKLINNAIAYTRELMTELKPPPSIEGENLVGNICWIANKMKKHNLAVTVEEDNCPGTLSEEILRTLNQCVRELLYNVIKHAGVNEAVISVSCKENLIRITVKDNGMGFHSEKEFPDPAEYEGFGFFSIHERMDWIGGRVEIQSEPGKGTTVHLLVPITKNNLSGDTITKTSLTESPPHVSSHKGNENQGKIKVLLVDDHQMVRKGLKNLIEEQGDLVVIAEAVNGKEAVELTRDALPEIIVMDVNMPVMNGIEATQIISLQNQTVRIIGLSLHDDKKVKEAMMNAGASGYLTKTEAFESLSALIRSEALRARKNNP